MIDRVVQRFKSPLVIPHLGHHSSGGAIFASFPLQSYAGCATRSCIPFRFRSATFDYQRLATALATRESSYRLLLWISDAIDKGNIQPSRVAHQASNTDAAKAWLDANYAFIPVELRPARDRLDEFAAFFSTYLTSSFDVVDKPGKRGEGPISASSCRCELCLRIVNAPHLQAKKLHKADKQHAEYLIEECLGQLAREHRLNVDEASLAALLENSAMRRSAAYVTYADWLIRRLSGDTAGPALLALWRIIAWDPRGGMRLGFLLRIEDIQAAEQAVLSAMRPRQ